ncbi:MAG: hypothetical protein WBH01_02585 [Dehalococcoidia bacterium]
MRSFLLLIAILALLLLPMGCADTQQITQDWLDKITLHATGTYTIKVGGTAGLYFTGEYVVNFYEYHSDTDTWDVITNRYTTEGVVPREYTFEAMVAGGFFQKQTGDETLLQVEIWKEGVLQDSASTTDPWGAVMVAGGP